MPSGSWPDEMRARRDQTHPRRANQSQEVSDGPGVRAPCPVAAAVVRHARPARRAGSCRCDVPVRTPSVRVHHQLRARQPRRTHRRRAGGGPGAQGRQQRQPLPAGIEPHTHHRRAPHPAEQRHHRRHPGRPGSEPGVHGGQGWGRQRLRARHHRRGGQPDGRPGHQGGARGDPRRGPPRRPGGLRGRPHVSLRGASHRRLPQGHREVLQQAPRRDQHPAGRRDPGVRVRLSRRVAHSGPSAPTPSGRGASSSAATPQPGP
ncbi:hypothetical protein [Ornithinimicrobium kibberense]|uniref:hypothetical protein n=1 Tax=Ornithinimicrobium kibberense TaxID=282060 RepID=UPI00360A5F4D